MMPADTDRETAERIVAELGAADDVVVLSEGAVADLTNRITAALAAAREAERERAAKVLDRRANDLRKRARLFMSEDDVSAADKCDTARMLIEQEARAIRALKDTP